MTFERLWDYAIKEQVFPKEQYYISHKLPNNHIRQNNWSSTIRLLRKWEMRSDMLLTLNSVTKSISHFYVPENIFKNIYT